MMTQHMLQFDIFDAPFGWFVVSIGLTSGLYLLSVYGNHKHNNAMKNVIKDEVRRLKKIYGVIKNDLDKFDGDNRSDLKIANEISLYFERKYPTLVMMRMNINNHLSRVSKFHIFNRKYEDHVNLILKDLETFLEICYKPKLPLELHLSIWRDKKDIIGELFNNTHIISIKSVV